MKLICDTQKCTGCYACINVCLNNAIVMKDNEQGFFYPKIVESKCVNCDLCIKTCPVNQVQVSYNHKAVFAALDKNDEERAKSTSGGVFACLARKVIKAGGYVYGAELDTDLLVHHVETHTHEEMNKLRNSKYMQSQIGLSYRQAKKRLEEGSSVLFSGTPCQIAGLRKYLKKDYPNLLAVDILCHGVPSSEIFRKYRKNEERKVSSSMISIQFRTKIIGWKENVTIREFANGKIADCADTFVPGFLSDYFLRESCYSCIYATDKRQGDISLGDYWGYQESAPEYIEDDDKGISLVIINTEKGLNAFKNIRKEIAFATRTMDDAKRGNPILYKSSVKPDDYTLFWHDAKTMNWNELSKKYIHPQDKNDWMNKELRDYYDIPFIKRHRKHKRRICLSKVYNRVKRIGENK